MDEELVSLNEELIDLSSRAGSPAAYLVNTFPIRALLVLLIYVVFLLLLVRYWPSFLPGGQFKHEITRFHARHAHLQEVLSSLLGGRKVVKYINHHPSLIVV